MTGTRPCLQPVHVKWRRELRSSRSCAPPLSASQFVRLKLFLEANPAPIVHELLKATSTEMCSMMDSIFQQSAGIGALYSSHEGGQVSDSEHRIASGVAWQYIAARGRKFFRTWADRSPEP
jgi:hypothetical protein